MNGKACMRCFISGKVQGVWFRASAKGEADILGITGWARNLSDGRVEVLACGSREQLDSFYAWLQEGPQMSDVSHHSREDIPWQDCSCFEVR